MINILYEWRLPKIILLFLVASNVTKQAALERTSTVRNASTNLKDTVQRHISNTPTNLDGEWHSATMAPIETTEEEKEILAIDGDDEEVTVSDTPTTLISSTIDSDIVNNVENNDQNENNDATSGNDKNDNSDTPIS